MYGSLAKCHMQEMWTGERILILHTLSVPSCEIFCSALLEPSVKKGLAVALELELIQGS
jgi:hypothetical protein